jgi:hypothetical protein
MTLKAVEGSGPDRHSRKGVITGLISPHIFLRAGGSFWFN